MNNNLPEEPLLSVKEFAKRTNRFTNQLYCLINYGNSYRKLRAIRVKGLWMIPESEITDYPFNKAVKLKNELTERVDNIEERLIKLEERVGL